MTHPIGFIADSSSILCAARKTFGERGDTDKRLLYHRELPGLHLAASIYHYTLGAQEDGRHAAGTTISGETCTSSLDLHTSHLM